MISGNWTAGDRDAHIPETTVAATNTKHSVSRSTLGEAILVHLVRHLAELDDDGLIETHKFLTDLGRGVPATAQASEGRATPRSIPSASPQPTYDPDDYIDHNAEWLRDLAIEADLDERRNGG